MNKPQPGQSEIYATRRLSLPDAASEDDDAAIDLRGLFVTVWRGKWIIAVCTLIAALLGFFATSQTTPIYRGTATVLFVSDRTNVVNMLQVVADPRFDASELEDQMQILQSTVLIERVINELGLHENPEFNPFLQISEPTAFERLSEVVTLPPEIKSLAINMGLVRPAAPQGDPLDVERRERLAVIRNVRSRLELLPIGESRAIVISFMSVNPGTAAAAANSFALQYIDYQIEAKFESARSATAWLNNRAEELRVKLQAAEEAIQNAESEMSEEVGQTLEITQSQLSSLNGALFQAKVEVSRSEALYSMLTEALEDERHLGTISHFRAAPLIQSYRLEESQLMDERAILQFTFSDDNRALALLDRKLQQVRENIREEAGRIVEAAELDLRAAGAQRDALLAEVRSLENILTEQAAAQVRLRQFEREAEASRLVYENILGRLQEANAQRDLLEPDARLLSPAERPLFPERVAERRTQLIATVLGVLAGVGLVFLLERLNNCVRSSAELEELTGEAVLGALPSVGPRMMRSQIIRHIREKPRSSLVEAVRNLRTSILFSNIDRPPKVVMFSSSLPREGKSTTSMLVAMTTQQMGKSAIIVDCDLRLPQLAGLVGAEDHEHGLLSVLEGTTKTEDAVFTDPDTGLHILTTVGSEQSSTLNAADILSSQKFSLLLKELSETYDLVILDTPPTLVVADARIVARNADAVVYVVRWNETPRGALLDGLKELRSVGAPIAGVVMTQVNEGRAARYAYNGYYSYKDKYRGYYTN